MNCGFDATGSGARGPDAPRDEAGADVDRPRPINTGAGLFVPVRRSQGPAQIVCAASAARSRPSVLITWERDRPLDTTPTYRRPDRGMSAMPGHRATPRWTLPTTTEGEQWVSSGV
jgi:hypothetical protein